MDAFSLAPCFPPLPLQVRWQRELGMQPLQGQNVVNSIDGWKSRPKSLIQNGALLSLPCLDKEHKLH